MKKYITKRAISAVFILFCTVGIIFYILGTYPLFDYGFLENATEAYTMNGAGGAPIYIFSGDELEIVLGWAKTIVPTERIGQLLLPAEPTITIAKGDEKLEICTYDPHNKFELILYYNGSIYGGISESESFTRVIDLLRSVSE
ncbi:MAG: hypothetical protein IJN37_00740 [Clostridia bacterium]|nr:hypothetical protein [Clostridia bacterium]MBQ6932890.1 hypothetical protein [Clostridia bacterium]